jgi:hypothetical protein
MGIKHMADTVFEYPEIQSAMNTLRPQLSHYGQEVDLPNDVSLSFGNDGWLRWILNDVHVSGKVIDHQGTIKWRVKDIVNSKTFVELFFGDNDNPPLLHIKHSAYENVLAVIEATAGLYVDQIMAGSLKFEVSRYERK